MIFYKKFEPLLNLINSSYNYIVLTGGRGGGKTGHAIRGVLCAMLNKKLRVCFFRETKDTIQESVKAEIDSVIDLEFKNRGFIIKNERIESRNGGYIFFKGLKEVNLASIENLKGIASSCDIFVIDEAQTVSKKVLDTLIATMRKAGFILILIYNRIKDDLPVEECLFIDYESKTAPAKTYFVEVNYPELVPCGIISKEFIERAELVKKNKPGDYKTIYLNQVEDESDLNVVRYWSAENIDTVYG